MQVSVRGGGKLVGMMRALVNVSRSVHGGRWKRLFRNLWRGPDTRGRLSDAGTDASLLLLSEGRTWLQGSCGDVCKLKPLGVIWLFTRERNAPMSWAVPEMIPDTQWVAFVNIMPHG